MKVLKRVKNDQMIYGKTAAIRDLPAEFGDIQTIATGKIVEIARILHSKSSRFALNTRKRSTKTKRLALKISRVWAGFARNETENGKG